MLDEQYISNSKQCQIKNRRKKLILFTHKTVKSKWHLAYTIILKGETIWTIWTILNHLGLKPFEMFFIEYCIDFKKYYSIILFMNPFYTIMNFLLY